ncbi:DNA helicase RecQ [Eubacterium sp. OM08-24]|uniref:DNA helicase RecQ n=1 Tax=Eubacterium sp. OM08-24 TaxID=2292352 RepID=UPI000E442688|nr:DNA helicase RecQ [Eubacterium sp. OM08-24]RGM22416.1 DNA helicase RecQ [Eubacterium sp. OM08-24]
MNKFEILKHYFGHDTFRDGQENIIDNISNGNDALCIMPTGGGKSICYQIPALMSDGIAIVISPLISLMKDQVTSLNQNGIRAAYINSTLTSAQQSRAIYNAMRGEYKLIYVAPERLEVPAFLNLCNSIKISLIAVDEAHCVSQWGHDFRPSYLKIADFISKLDNRPVISAFTATATDAVKRDILNLLGLKNPYQITTGFDRKNLFFAVKRPQRKQKELLAIVSEHKNQSGIIYCATRKNVEKVSDFLNDNGYRSLIYHAGLNSEIRNRNQEDFINDRCNLIVATNAFGMGIDKPDVRFVVHYNMPKNLENYYQEAGRAGRDGENSDCILLYSPADVHTQRFFIENNDENDELTDEQREKIKKNDYYKLNKMVGYCTSTTCLRNYILNYFGEYHTNDCNNCSACLKEYKLTDVTVDSQKILSCIIKTRQRYGASTIIDVLAGSKKESIINAGLDEQSTYGIMSKTKKAAISELITKLIDEEYIHQTEGKYPILEVTQKSYPILKGQKNLTMRLAVKEDLHREIQQAEIDRSLFDKLKERRKYLADKASVPPYVIFSDASLRDMCAKLPTNENDFLRISGVGIKKQEKYAKEFIPIIKEYKNSKS